MIQLDLSILNQKGTPMFNSDIFANRPAAGIAGRIFISTDTLAIYRDTGTTWDTIGGGGGGGTINGSIAAGQVAFGTALNTIGGNNNLFWDNSNARLGIGINVPLYVLDVAGSGRYTDNLLISKNFAGITAISIINTTSNALSASQLDIFANTAAGGVSVGKYSTLKTAYSIIAANDSFIWNQTAGNIAILNDFATGTIKFSAGATSTAQMTLFSTGNVLIGTTTDGGQRLQVYGVTYIKGTGSSSSTNSLVIQNSASANTLLLSDTGNLTVNSVTTGTVRAPTSGNLLFEPGAGNARIIMKTFSQGYVDIINPDGAFVPIAGTTISLNLSQGFAPTSGSANMNWINLTPTINQVGATGVTRSIYINPVLNAAADWRSIEWTNNSGWGLYGSGTAPSYFNGNVQIGNTTAISNLYKLQLTGRQYILHTSTYSGAGVQSFVTSKNVTINQTISGGNGLNNQINTGLNIFSSTQTIPETTTYATIFNYNEYQFSAAGITLFASQSAGGIRSVSQLTTQNVFGGAFNGTMSHVSGIQINGYYNPVSGITPTITNAYQLLINDTGEFGHPFTFTNRWGIYQRGINDRNYLEGNLLLNSTTDTGQILQVNGAIRVNGQASGSAGGNSGNHLIINVDGTQYKIALLNP
jgi:hypothetical protein